MKKIPGLVGKNAQKSKSVLIANQNSLVLNQNTETKFRT